jgi:hypothetical protein
MGSGKDADVTLPDPGAPTHGEDLAQDPSRHVREGAAGRPGTWVGVSTPIREWIAAGVTAEAEDQQISLAQLRTAIASVVQSSPAA